MRSSLLSVERQITSSRQSPRMSAHRHGLTWCRCSTRSRRADSSVDLASRLSQSHLVIVVPSSSLARAGRRPTRCRSCTSAACASRSVSPLTFQTPRQPRTRRPHLVARCGAGRCPAPRRGRRPAHGFAPDRPCPSARRGTTTPTFVLRSSRGCRRLPGPAGRGRGRESASRRRGRGRWSRAPCRRRRCSRSRR